MEQQTSTLKLNGSQPLVLVVDDVARNVQFLGTMLADNGFRVAFAMNGGEALDVAASAHPDLILLDIMMPGIDGYEVCRRLKENPTTHHVPVIFLSARSELNDKVEGFAAGGVDYMTKPFHSTEVLTRVRTHIQLKRAQDTIREYTQDLERMLAARTEHLIQAERQAAFGLLVQGIVHNLRSPLSGIIGNADLARTMCDSLAALQRNPESQDEAKQRMVTLEKTLGAILRAGNQMNKMISSLMTRSRKDKSSAIESVNLNDAVSTEVDFLSADLWFKHSVDKQIERSPEALNIEVIPAELSQVLQNILQNAIHALKSAPEPTLAITTGRSGIFAYVRIGDNGCGIPADALPRIFDPFYTTKPTADSGDGVVGTGLGLYMCNQMVHSYDGRIEVVSNPNEGTIFTVLLPLAM